MKYRLLEPARAELQVASGGNSELETRNAERELGNRVLSTGHCPPPKVLAERQNLSFDHQETISSLPFMSPNPYAEILSALARAEVDFILGGGLACVLHGAERVTMDADVSVLMSAENFGRFLEAMRQLGLKPRVPVDPSTLLDARVLRMLVEEKRALVFSFLDPDRPIRQVDLFLRTDYSFESLLPAAEWIELDGFRIRVLSKAKLLEQKLAIQPPRTKDAIDIEFLRRHAGE